MLQQGDDDDQRNRAAPWIGLAIGAAVLALWALHSLAQMQLRVEYLEGQLQRLIWRDTDAREHKLPGENSNDGRDSDHRP